MKTIEELLQEDKNVSNELKKAMAHAKFNNDDLLSIKALSGAETARDLLYEVEKILFDGGVK